MSQNETKEEQLNQVNLPNITEVNEVKISVSGSRGLLSAVNAEVLYESRDHALQIGRILGGANCELVSVMLSTVDDTPIASLTPSNFTPTEGEWLITPVDKIDAKSASLTKVLAKIKDTGTIKFSKAGVITLSRTNTSKADIKKAGVVVKVVKDLDVGVDLQETASVSYTHLTLPTTPYV